MTKKVSGNWGNWGEFWVFLKALEDGHFALSDMALNPIKGKNLTITGDGTQQRDFTHVEDIVQGLILAGKNIKKAEYQLGTGKQYSILEIAKAFDHPYEFIPPRRGERPSGLADIKQTIQELGYKPKHNIMNYIKECI